uniref:Penicillin-binding protein transpeptidase domain-containing protein n=1 Tax=Biomphalaria glabrata TaxID=6526 RepID=A0A2C9KL27_BIOGL
MSVYSTLSIEYQEFAKKALREGLEEYDRRHGWRGAIANINVDPSDSTDLLNNFNELRKNSECSFCAMGLVSEVYVDYATVVLEDMSHGVIKLSKTKWAKQFIDNDTIGPNINSMHHILRVGDVVFVKKEQNNDSEYLLHQVPKVNGAIIVIEPSTGRVLAMSGGYSYEDNQFNRATQAFRQPGSVFKTFVYLSAFENGLMPNTVVLDDHLYIDQGPGMPLWQPRNIGNTFLGPITVRAGFEKSRNLSTIRIARFVGMENITKTANKLNIYSSDIKNYATLLGSEVVSLMTMTRAYAIIANGGYDINCHLIDRIQNVYGSDLYKENYVTCEGCSLPFSSKAFNMLTPLPPEVHMNKPQIIDPVYAYQMTSLLEGAVKRGTAMPARINNQYIAGKTGTTNHNMDAWFIGFTNDMVVGVYVGFDVPATLGKRETGSRVALPIFKKFMQKALQDKQSKPFKIPLGINIVEVDANTGMPVKKIKNTKDIHVINEAFAIGDESKIISLIERKHYYDEDKNRWMVELEEDHISQIIKNITKTFNNK